MTTDASAKVYNVWDQMAPGWTRDTQLLWDSSRVIGEDMVERLGSQPGDVVLELDDDVPVFRRELETAVRKFATTEGYEIPGMCLSVVAR